VRELKQIVARAYLLADGEALRVELPEHRTLDHAERAGSIAFRVGMSFEEVEQRMLRETLRYFGNDKARAAAALGISLKTIYNRRARCGAGPFPEWHGVRPSPRVTTLAMAVGVRASRVTMALQSAKSD
jgi:DNA-binding NtrC family response regulator